jgi:hypothetical protein
MYPVRVKMKCEFIERSGVLLWFRQSWDISRVKVKHALE